MKEEALAMPIINLDKLNNLNIDMHILIKNSGSNYHKLGMLIYSK